MNIVKSFQNLITSVTEGFARIFKASEDDYPKTGVQPFEGKTASRKHR
ncbi:MAG: isochorismate synthase [Cyanobacteriota bacterium ELA615]|jgi:hypothetical protein